ncbi:Gfo/Idh/MocA family protein [Phaeodactylibacter xiamenensis]|jgi:predicted dehydrogenase|uniref:Gfo/Idh/MocA family protein n=1 Tax=Phaeodactylibacter xiamenensis TaxID=1524460 RepID=UPI003BAA08B4
MKKPGKKGSKGLDRRTFIRQAGVAAAGMTIVPSTVVSGLGHVMPSDKLNIAGVGVGGMGRSNLRNMNSQNIVALCDVDWKYAAKCFNDYPDAAVYKDYRRMMDDMGDEIDAVVVGTPDHTHYVVTADAMRAGKHVYVQKPLTHSVYESRMLAKLAKETGVATQMGNQGNSGEGIRQVCEWIWNGEIGEVKEVHAWTNRPIWPQGLERPTETPSVPPTLDWDLFIGPAKWRPYHPAYTPWNWRAWWDFGTGALGDMGCHIIDPVFKALNLGQPTAFEGSSSQVNTESAPIAEKVTYYFPERKKMGKVNMPAVEFTWYDGGLLPDRPKGIPEGKILGDGGGGAMFVGSKGTLICSTYARDPYIVGRENDPPKATNELRRVETSHEMDWVRACKEDKSSRTEASSHFGYSAPLNEVVVMGNLAIRLQDLKRKLEWDGANMKITNIADDEEIRVVSSDKFTVVDGDPRFDTQYATINAKQAMEEYIKRPYRKGWNY